jgi:hypothetical protein
MNPPLAHLMYSDQQSVDDVVRDRKYALLAHKSPPLPPSTWSDWWKRVWGG